jgi:hypothetical protein
LSSASRSGSSAGSSITEFNAERAEERREILFFSASLGVLGGEKKRRENAGAVF